MLTFVIPVGPNHEAVVEDAIASCLNQTLRVSVVVVYDREGRGAGYTRNRGLEQVKTPFVSFLDADDLLEPTFSEVCLRAYDGRHYVYTDWITDTLVKAPPNPWFVNDAAHIMTTLLPTSFVRHIGGFDESLPFCEDTEFYYKLTRSGLCGKHLPLPLFQYRKGGRRSMQMFEPGHEPETGDIVFNTRFYGVMRTILTRYGGKAMPCTDCGGNELHINDQPLNAPEPGDVLAEALWAGERPERGRVSRRIYRGGWNSRLWMDPRDIDAAPNLFARVVEMPGIPTDDDFQAFAMQAMHAMTGNAPAASQKKVAPEPIPPVYGTQGEVRPDVGRVLRLYQNQ